MNIISIIIFIIITLVAFGLPVWNLARLAGSNHVGWMLLVPVIMVILFGLVRMFEGPDTVDLYKFFRSSAFIVLVSGLILFGVTVLVMSLNFFFDIPNNTAFWSIIGITAIIVAASFINGQRIIVKDLNIPAHDISRPYHFVHITDLHSGSTNVRHAKRVADMIKEINPEFVVITGDFIDEYFVEQSDIQPIADLSMPTYLITGNHEYYLKPGKIEEVVENTDIELIDREKIQYDELDIIGVNELETAQRTLEEVGGVDPSRYTILLEHEPKTEEVEYASQQGIDLMLSGHTHKGQIWPMEYLIKLRYWYVAGLYKIGEMFLYVNQGTGTLGPMMRLGTVNEITDIHLLPNQNEL